MWIVKQKIENKRNLFKKNIILIFLAYYVSRIKV